MSIEATLRAFGSELGFSRIGICRVEPGETIEQLRAWIENGMHGKMRYMENPKRQSPSSVLDGVRTMVVAALNYRWPEGSDLPQEGMISRYAWGADYHEVLLPMLESLAGRLRELAPSATTRAYVDTGPIAEKYWAQKAGIGWIGKHSNVLSRTGSSWFFLGVVLTDAELSSDEQESDHCGTCERCIVACPTQAIVAPYVVDARLCISYLTIELRESIPRELRAGIGHRIFGCDDCQDVCPWNRFAYAGDPRFNPRQDLLSATLSGYLQLTAPEFRDLFAGTNVLRAKYRGFLRNCLVAAGNSGRHELIPHILAHLNGEDEMLREHAAWALGRLGELRLLEARRNVETSTAVLKEIALALA